MQRLVLIAGLAVAVGQAATALAQRPQNASQRMQRIQVFDQNKDGRITRGEAPPQMWHRLQRLDANRDDVLDAKELAELARRFAGNRSRPSSRPDANGDQVEASEGQPAPDFKLSTLDGKFQVELSSFRDKQPVALIFGSYT